MLAVSMAEKSVVYWAVQSVVQMDAWMDAVMVALMV